MFKNYINIAIRNLLRNKSASLIKIISLSVGMICFSIIALFVYHELSFDRFHENPEKIYRVVKDFVNDDGSKIPDATTPPALAPALWNELPEVESATRVFPNWGRKYLLQVGDDKRYEEQVVRIDSSFFDVFSFPFIKGDKKSSLSNPNFILITERTAKRYFQNEDPMGKAIKIDIGKNGTDFFVTGILKDVPENSHFNFDFLISVRSFQYKELDTDWGWYNFYTYVRLKPETEAQTFLDKLQPLYNKHRPESKTQYYAQVITDIHLKSNLKWELSTNGDYSYIRILATIALFTILLAAINYINLVTAQSAKRAKEVGIRKVSGAPRPTLISQFLFESLIMAIVATIISLAVVESILPLMKDVFNSTLSFLDPVNINVLWIVIGAGLATGILAGLYPAFYLSSFQPVRVLKGAITGFGGNGFLRKGLVTFQFIISTVLITGTFVISSQIDFVRNKKLGFGKENIMLVPNAGNLQNLEAVLTEMRKINGVVNAGGADGVIGGQNWTTGTKAKDHENSLLLNFLCTDHEFLNVMGVEFLEGRNFSPDNPADSAGVILNEAAVKQLDIAENTLGTQLEWYTDAQGNQVYATVIGVIKDFHFTSFHDPIKPFAFDLYQPRINTLFIKINGDNLQTVIDNVKKTWASLVPDRPFEFTFQDEQVAKLYAGEVKFQKLFSNFTYIAIVIACLGLFGLSTYTAQQRTKEIGIRKVLGASVLGITGLLSTEFLKIVLLAVAVSIPIAWYGMQEWLKNFAYHVDMNVWVFVSSASLAIFIALFTISFQSVKAAISNPVESLRSE